MISCVSLFHKPLYLARMRVRLFIIINGDEQQIALVFIHHVKILLILDLLQRSGCALIALEFDDHRGDIWNVWTKYDVGIALARR